MAGVERVVKIDDVKRYLSYVFSYFLDYPFTIPKEVNFQVTNKCPLRCKMCSIWKLKNRGKELSLEEMKELIDQIAEWGPKYVSFVGGEALVRKEVTIELVKYAASKGLHTTIVSNAELLDEKTCRRLLEAGLKRLALSLDGATAKTHDRIRGKGNFKKIIKTAKFILKIRKPNQLKVDFTTVVMSYNFRELIDIYYLAKKIGIDQVFFQSVVPDNTYKNFNTNTEFWIKEGEIGEFTEIIEKLVELKKADENFIFNSIEYLRNMLKYFALRENFRPGICLAGYMNMNIDPYGRIGICNLGPNIDVRGKNLPKLWKSEEYRKLRQLIKKCKRPCMMLCYEKLGVKEVFELLSRAFK
jgi:MoaA/NifB/PqqE/SkfB family radical SAM enzyme